MALYEGKKKGGGVGGKRKVKVEDGGIKREQKGDQQQLRKRKREEEDPAGDKKKGKSAYSTAVDAEGKPDWKKMRVERKKLKESRKKKDMKPEVYELSKEAKLIWEDLRRETTAADLRENLAKKMFNLVKGHIKRLSFAHDTSRVLESLLMHGTDQIRRELERAFSSKDDFLSLVKSKYGHFLAFKLMKYGSKEEKDGMFRIMLPQTISLLRHQFGSRILNEFYMVHAKAAQKWAFIRECYSPLLRDEEGFQLKPILAKFQEKKTSIMQGLQDLISFMLEKELKSNVILHQLMHEFLENCEKSERAELIETMREELVNILHTPEGAALGMSCVWHGTPKDRKVIVKSFKTFVSKIAMDKNGHRVLLAVIDSVDDVVLISKAICSEVLNNMNELTMNQFGQRVVAYMLEHRTSLFFDPEVCKGLAEGDGNEYTKKPIAQKLQDMTEPLEQEFVDSIVDNFGMWVKENSPCLITKFILKRFSTNPRALEPALEKIAETAAELPTKEGIEKTAVEMLCKYIQTELPDEAKASFARALLSHISSNNALSAWLQTNRGCFTFLRIWEKCGFDADITGEVKRLVTSYSSVLKKQSFAGAEKLKQLVK